jgi:hypothetical protein
MEVAAGAPDAASPAGGRGEIFVFELDGVLGATLSAEFGERAGLALAAGVHQAAQDRASFVIGDKGFDHGGDIPNGGRVTIGVLRNNGFEVLELIEGDREDRELGDEVFVVRDANGNNLAAMTYMDDNDDDREIKIVPMTVGGVSRALTPAVPSAGSFGESMVSGRLVNDGVISFAIGAHQAERDGGEQNAGSIYFTDESNESLGLYNGNSRDAEQGRALAVLPRPGVLDFLIIGSRRRGVDIMNPFDRQIFPVEPPGGADPIGEFGRALSMSRSLPDGTYRLFVGQPNLAQNAGRVLIYSIR